MELDWEFNMSFNLYVLQSKGTELSGLEGSKNRGGGEGKSAGTAGGSQRMAGICHLSTRCTGARAQQEATTGLLLVLWRAFAKLVFIHFRCFFGFS